MSFSSQSQCQSCEFPTVKLVADEEFLPFAQNSFDLVVSSLRYAFLIGKKEWSLPLFQTSCYFVYVIGLHAITY